jgi:hypothetical protein
MTCDDTTEATATTRARVSTLNKGPIEGNNSDVFEVVGRGTEREGLLYSREGECRERSKDLKRIDFYSIIFTNNDNQFIIPNLL